MIITIYRIINFTFMLLNIGCLVVIETTSTEPQSAILAVEL